MTICATCAFVTERLAILPWHLGTADATVEDAILALLTERVTSDLPLEWQGEYSRERVRDWISERDRDGANLLVRDKASGDAVGLIILHETGVPEAVEAVELRLGYLLAETAWGRGLGGELVAGLVSWCRGQSGIARIVGDVASGNQASKRVMEKCGFIEASPGDDDGPSATLEFRLDLRKPTFRVE